MFLLGQALMAQDWECWETHEGSEVLRGAGAEERGSGFGRLGAGTFYAKDQYGYFLSWGLPSDRATQVTQWLCSQEKNTPQFIGSLPSGWNDMRSLPSYRGSQDCQDSI